MEARTKIIIALFFALVLLGSFLQTRNYFPNFLNKEFDRFAGMSTMLLFGIAMSTFGLIFFLRSRAREGFEDAPAENPMEQWKTITSSLKLDELCDIFLEIKDSMIPLERGEPTIEGDKATFALTEEQAREKVDTKFQKETENQVFSCNQYQALQDAKDIDTFFVKIEETPTNFFVRAYQTARACRKFLRDQLIGIQTELTYPRPKYNEDSSDRKIFSAQLLEKYPLEPFVDRSVGICSADVIEERRKFLREKKLTEQQQACLLPEEVPLESKEDISKNKIKTILNAIGEEDMKKLPIIMEQNKKYMDMLKEYKKKAESGTLTPEQDSNQPNINTD